jgi:hypothetical protein
MLQWRRRIRGSTRIIWAYIHGGHVGARAELGVVGEFAVAAASRTTLFYPWFAAGTSVCRNRAGLLNGLTEGGSDRGAAGTRPRGNRCGRDRAPSWRPPPGLAGGRSRADMSGISRGLSIHSRDEQRWSRCRSQPRWSQRSWLQLALGDQAINVCLRNQDRHRVNLFQAFGRDALARTGPTHEIGVKAIACVTIVVPVPSLIVIL